MHLPWYDGCMKTIVLTPEEVEVVHRAVDDRMFRLELKADCHTVKHEPEQLERTLKDLNTCADALKKLRDKK